MDGAISKWINQTPHLFLYWWRVTYISKQANTVWNKIRKYCLQIIKIPLQNQSTHVVTTTYSTTKIHRKEWENCISWVTTTKEGVAVVSCWINDLSSKSWRLPFGLRNETSYFKVHKYPFSRHTGWQSKRNCLVVLPSALCCDAGWYSQCSKIGKIVQ